MSARKVKPPKFPCHLAPYWVDSFLFGAQKAQISRSQHEVHEVRQERRWPWSSSLRCPVRGLWCHLHRAPQRVPGSLQQGPPVPGYLRRGVHHRCPRRCPQHADQDCCSRQGVGTTSSLNVPGRRWRPASCTWI